MYLLSCDNVKYISCVVIHGYLRSLIFLCILIGGHSVFVQGIKFTFFVFKKMMHIKHSKCP